MLFDVLSYIAAFLASLQATIILAVAASFAAIASWRAVLANRKAFEGNLLSNLMNEYAHEEMRKALTAVRNHLDNPSEKPLDDVQRRMVSHFFQKVHRLYEARLVSKKFARRAIDAGQAALFLEMEPLERPLHRGRMMVTASHPSPFVFYSKLHRLPRATEKAAPVIGAAHASGRLAAGSNCRRPGAA